MDTKDTFKHFLTVLFFILSAWVAITTTIMAFSHPEYTETQLFLSIPKAFILNFN